MARLVAAGRIDRRSIQKMGSMGVAMVAECGPGKVLSKLTKRCVHEMEGIALADEASIDSHLNLE